MNYLPDSIILEIFNHLNVQDLGIAAGVCQRWYILAHDPILRHVLNVTFVRLTGLQIWRLFHLQAASCVREVHLLGQFTCSGYHHGNCVTAGHSISPSLTSFTLPELSVRCPNLHSLFLSDMCLAFNTNGSVVTLNDFPPSLRRLGIRSSLLHIQKFFTDDPEQVLPDLVYLDVGLCNLMNTNALERLSSWGSSLHALGLERCTRIGDDSLERVPELLQSLVVLDLEGTGVSEEGFGRLLRTATNLQQLYVGQSKFAGQSLHLMKLGSLPKLRRICLRDTEVNADTILRLVKVAQNLEVIYLSTGALVEGCAPNACFSSCKIVVSGVLETKTCGHFLSSGVRQVGLSSERRKRSEGRLESKDEQAVVQLVSSY
ncbi:F-box/LRR-repeat protein 12-like isoform X2 [Ornithodoros turicata]